MTDDEMKTVRLGVIPSAEDILTDNYSREPLFPVQLFFNFPKCKDLAKPRIVS